MTSVLILTHGGLAAEMLRSARVIAGDLTGFEALCLDWDDSIDTARAKVGAAVERLDRGDGVLILTDIFGGTPSNAAKSFYRAGRIEIVSGVNLPMVVRLGCVLRQPAAPPVDVLARLTAEKGRASIRRSTSTRPTTPQRARDRQREDLG
ncbi:MAG: PTS sugar transporter subunit IIA [Acidobacteria bacterium]|nr:MAG: PTS sugar transporter subunit IIA [Acidobacteriota bacterium]